MEAGGKDIETLRDRIYDLEADRRQLHGDLEEQKQQNQELREQLGMMREANQELLKFLNENGYAPSSRGSDEEDVYFASKSKSHFHRPGCAWAQYILQSPNLIEFGSHAEAVQAGYKPCKTCRA